MRLGVAMLGTMFASAAAVAQPVLNPTFADPVPAAPGILMTDTGTPVGPSLGPGPGIHGYLSTGVATHDGREVDGAALVPIVPGRVTLEVGGGTGQIGVPVVSGSRKTATYSAYNATLHVQATDTLQIAVGVSGDSLRAPGAIR